ncbi:alkaline phosphatase [Arenimonas oryziterrae]|nr:alkaline phosphatase [Arenimonas oryziterrae]
MRSNFRIALLAVLGLAGCAATPVSRSPAPAVATTTAPITVPAIARPQGESPAWWFRAGAASAQSRGAGQARAKNVILFIGDGMSLPTVAAARIFEGQSRQQPGEENQLSFERFPYTALSRTYNTDSQTPDSAGTMTAMITGAKTRIGMLSVGQEARRGDCAAGKKTPLATAVEIAEAAGLSTGVVTTTRLTHATPGATYGHVSERNWENDVEMPADAKAAGCLDLARQLVGFDIGNGIEVAMGGGRSQFLPAETEDPERARDNGVRLDGRNLIEEWQQRHPDGRYVWNGKQLAALDLAHTAHLLGLFEPDHMNYEHDRRKDAAGEPSLTEMTRAAITVLQQNPKGFFLVVESGRIDHAHHASNAYRALTETISLSDAVRAATEMTDEADTLILVTADHSHTMSFVGYPQRGNPILGKVTGGASEDDAAGLARDKLGLPFTTLNYTNGPGYAGASSQQPAGPKHAPHTLSMVEPAIGRPDLTNVDTQDPDYLQESMWPLSSETHGGDDVGVWARGPGSAAVRGSIEQNTIFHLLVQSQPTMVKLLCDLGDCENGVPVKLPALGSLRPKK